MSFILKLLTGSAGPWVLSGLAVAFLMLSGGLAIQTHRVEGAKADLKEARAALYVPGADGKPTKLTWRAKAEAAERNLGTCQTNGLKLQVEIGRQNAAVDTAAAEGRQRTADAEKAVQAARTATQRAEKAAASILNRQPVGIDTCARVLDVDRQFLENLK